MHGMDRFPEIKRLFMALTAEKEAVLADSAALRLEYAALRAQQCALRDQIAFLAAQIRAIEMPRLVEIEMQRSSLARAMGGRALSDSPPERR